MELGILYSVVAAFLWGIQLVALKRYFAGYPATVLPVLINACAVVLYLPVAAATLSPAAVPDPASFSASDAGVVFVTVVCVAGGFILFLEAISVGEVSYVAPINKLAPVFVLPLEIGLLDVAFGIIDASLGVLDAVGITVATCAVYVANYEPGSLLEPFRRAAASTPARLALLSAAAYAVSDVGKRLALQEFAFPPQVWVLILLIGVPVVLLPFALREWPTGARADLPKFAALGGLVAAAEHVTSLAFQTVPASIASPVINTQAVVAVVLGGLLLGEENFGVRLVAGLLAVAGIGLIAL